MEERKSSIVDLVTKIELGCLEEKLLAVIDLRLLAKCDMETRQLIAEAGAIPALIPLLSSEEQNVQENAVTTLLNLSIFPGNRLVIMEIPGALNGILQVLRLGLTAEARQNAAATLFSLLIVEEYRVVVGRQPGAIASLLELLREGKLRGKKDAIKVLFHLALHPENKPKLVAAGAVPLLCSLINGRFEGFTEDALSVLTLLAHSVDGVAAIMQVSTLLAVVQVLKGGSPRAKENATALLLSLCETGGDDVVNHILQHNHVVVASLCSLLTVGSERAKRKANLLMKILVVNQSIDQTCTGNRIWVSDGRPPEVPDSPMSIRRQVSLDGIRGAFGAEVLCR